MERLLREGGLRARTARLYWANPGLHRFFAQHPNHLWGSRATGVNQVWVGDIFLSFGGRSLAVLGGRDGSVLRRILA